ncbi:glycoside hydrolase family protein [Vibrio alfacsensis]|uniref:glycoside hydrolase family protein n=1 Tax=Vibrio alfacsensis TaxID=1074311 RepID=UPI004067D4B8
MKLLKSVGIQGSNLPSDIKTVQHSLNLLVPNKLALKALAIDGKLGRTPSKSKTVEAIKLFQKKLVGMNRPDGRIDVNGRSHRKLKELLLSVTPSVNSAQKSSYALSLKGANLLKQIEQLKLHPYDDQNGQAISHWNKGATIGYGHLISQVDWDKYKNGINAKEADLLFAKDVKPFQDAVRNSLKVSVSQSQFDAMVIFAFNIGVGGFKESSALKLINDPESKTSYPSLEKAWKAWNKSQGKTNKGLINRRVCEWTIFTEGVYRGW